MGKSVIITCAVSIAIHTPAVSAHLPITPGVIAGSAIQSGQDAGA